MAWVAGMGADQDLPGLFLVRALAGVSCVSRPAAILSQVGQGSIAAKTLTKKTTKSIMLYDNMSTASACRVESTVYRHRLRGANTRDRNVLSKAAAVDGRIFQIAWASP